jgi:hypothetical protein
MQELTANTSTKIIFCGRQEIRKHLLCRTLHAMSNNISLLAENLISSIEALSPRWIRESPANAVSSFMIDFERIYHPFLLMANQLGNVRTFTLALLQLSKSAEQSDMRDKVYGILGILDSKMLE